MDKVLCRDTSKAKIFGVCAGIANHYGWELWLVRIVMFSGLILQGHLFLIGYFVAYFVLDACPSPSKKHGGGNDGISETIETELEVPNLKEQIWQAGESSTTVLSELEKSFDNLENRIRNIEKVVTSEEFSIHTEFNRL